MCGINGIFGERNRVLLERMNQCLFHRGPDDQGFYLGRQATLGMRRLSIIDLETGHQPITNEKGDLQIVFNGEIYNYRQLKTELQARGHRFSTETDTEVILHLYEEKGTETPRFLRGDFAFAVWNEKDQTGFMARDHLGVKPLYYAPLEDKLIFSSELKALFEEKRLSLCLNPEALDLYLTFLYVPSPLTIYRNIYKLPPGSCLEYQSGRYRVSSYWEPPVDQTPGISEKEMEHRVHTHLFEAVSMRLMSDVPLGAFLSGGIDSTAVVAFMSQSSSKPDLAP